MRSDATDRLLAAVAEIAPIISEHAPIAERERRIPAASYGAMLDAGLFAMLAPRAYGGLELHPVDAMKVWEAVGRIDASHAWNLVMNQAIAAYAAWLPTEGARELFADGPTTVAGALNPPAPARRVEGGWRVSGQVPFVSGCDNASWLAMPAVEMEGGQPKADPRSGRPAPIAVFFPPAEAQVLDTWHTVGMRGTGSADVRVDDLFVPDRRVAPVAPLDKPAAGFEGPLFRLWPWSAILGESIISVAVAARAVEELVKLVKTKTPAYQSTPLNEQPLAQHGAARAAARVEATRDTLYRAATQAYDQLGDGQRLDEASKTRLQLACAFAAETCNEAVRLVNDVAGTSSIRTSQPFERYLRDVHTLSQHASKSSQRYASAGRLMFGLENDWVWLSF